MNDSFGFLEDNIFSDTFFHPMSFAVGFFSQPWLPPAQEPTDPASKREEKIARYKRCKELDEKVAYLFLGISLAAVFFFGRKKIELILPGVMIHDDSKPILV